ncbi:MAG TPA: helicase HerA-like domain-containing protein [Isosphaeraceae bacterium]|nr:helicase HerA-like domain-containing protein [Isosphaeraceae bacterium]
MGPPARPADPRVAAFCSPERSEVFHAVAYRSDIWKEDPFDVETIHEEARAAFQRLVYRASGSSRPSAGRILLLLGEAGSGKTHLMRAFRNWTHARGRGYYGYMQMTSATSHYGRYVLNNLIDSLDQPYFESAGETSGLMRLSTAMAEGAKGLSIDRLDPIRNDELDPACLAKLIDALADQIVMDDRFNNIDIDLIRALLFLQSDDPRIKGRVLKYLRCEGLSDHDRRLLGGIVPRSYDDAPQWLIQRLGELMAALEGVPLILCVDQLEDIYSLDDAPARFRRAMATLCDLVSRIPTAVVVVSCLEDFYAELKDNLTKPLIDRLEKDPPPIKLKGPREKTEIIELIAHRLRSLYETQGATFRDDAPTYPFPPILIDKLAGLSAREVLIHCHEYRERCIADGRLVPPEIPPVPIPVPVPPTDTIGLEQAWNDSRTSFAGEVPVEEEVLAAHLAGAIEACSQEDESGRWFEAEANGRLVSVEGHAPDNKVDLLLVGVCNFSAKGGHLGRQVAEVVERAGEHTPVIVRSTEFSTNPKAAITKQMGELIARGGRRAVVEDSDWRAILAFPRFREAHRANPAFSDWLKEAKPLSRLRSLRAILDLDRQGGARPRRTEATDEAPPRENAIEPPVEEANEPVPAAEIGPIVVGTSNDRTRGPVALEPDELTRHAVFLGGTGCGKTTLALNVIEQLLLRGVPAILVDRKGDLVGYSRPEAWTRPLCDAELEARRERLRARVEVALYTPGNPQGRPLSIAVAPGGLGRLGNFERAQVARYAASALAGMMNYSGKGSDLSRQAILASAIDLLAQLEPDGFVALGGLIEYVAEKDPGLVNAVGRLDTKLFEKLVQDLETLRLTRGEFLAARGEPLDAEALLGLGRHATPGKTRLTVISTKSLGATQDVQFWVTQLLVELGRWASRSPSSRLQAALLFDEADLYLPALRQPPTKEPMEDLLRRARSAGLGLLLATQSPGDFDYKGRDNIRAWFVGRIKESTAIAKMKPMLSECRLDVESKLPTQETGQFHLLRDGAVISLEADRSAIPAEQVAEDEILALARRSRDPVVPGQN